MNPPVQTALPADTGWIVGTEVAYWTGKRDTFVQLFLRHAAGIAAYDPLAVPLTFANDHTTRGSSETLRRARRQLRGGARSACSSAATCAPSATAIPRPTTSQKYDEGILAVRPQLYLGERWGVAVEGAYQARRYAVLDPLDRPAARRQRVARRDHALLLAERPRLLQAPAAPPHLRAHRAQRRHARALPRAGRLRQRAVEHFLGLGVEWWFNSSSYP